MTLGNTPILVLKRMLGYFLKTPIKKKMLEFQDGKKTMKLLQKIKTYRMSFNN